LSKIGHTLTNNQYIKGNWQNLPFKTIKYKSDLAKIIDYRKDLYIFFNHNKDEHGNQISKKYPYCKELKTHNEK